MYLSIPIIIVLYTTPYTPIQHHTSPYTSIHHHTPLYITTHSYTLPYSPIHHHTPLYITIHHHTSPYITIHPHTSPYTPYITIHPYTSPYTSIREVLGRINENRSKSTNHKSWTTGFRFLGSSLKCKGNKAKKASLLQIVIYVAEKHKIQRRFWHRRSGIIQKTAVKASIIEMPHGFCSLMILFWISVMNEQTPKNRHRYQCYSKPIRLSFQEFRV